MSQNVCIYFSDTGGGHRSAAEALEASLRSLLSEAQDAPEISIIKDNVAEKSHPLNRRFVELYNYLLRHHQPLMKYYYWFLHTIKPESGFNLALTADYFKNLLRTHDPSVIVSVHPMTNHVIASAMKQIGMLGRIKLIVVVTDPNVDLWRAWACPDADLIIAPSQVVANRLMDYGIPEERLAVLGMPIHPEFNKPPSIERRQFLSHLGLASDVLTVCINAGWAGGGNMLRIYEQLSKVQRPLQALFLCGHNTNLYEQAMVAAAESDVPTAVLPFHDCMPDLMSAVDIMVSKAGGLTTYQAIARRLPLVFDVLTDPMPQERDTIRMLVENGLASSVYQAQDIIDIVETFQPNPERATAPLPVAYDFNLTDGASLEIGKRILKLAKPPIELTVAEESNSECDLQQKSMANKTAGET